MPRSPRDIFLVLLPLPVRGLSPCFFVIYAGREKRLPVLQVPAGCLNDLQDALYSVDRIRFYFG